MVGQGRFGIDRGPLSEGILSLSFSQIDKTKEAKGIKSILSKGQRERLSGNVKIMSKDVGVVIKVIDPPSATVEWIRETYQILKSTYNSNFLPPNIGARVKGKFNAPRPFASIPLVFRAGLDISNSEIQEISTETRETVLEQEFRDRFGGQLDLTFGPSYTYLFTRKDSITLSEMSEIREIFEATVNKFNATIETDIYVEATEVV